MRARFRSHYGANPLHLVGHLVMFAIVAFALDQIFSGGNVIQLLEWFIGFALLSDLVLIPLYTLIGRGMVRIPRVGAYIRAPALISGLLLLVFAPLIFDLGDHTYFLSSGHHPHGYLRNWLLVTACLFLISAATYLVRTWRAGRP